MEEKQQTKLKKAHNTNNSPQKMTRPNLKEHQKNKRYKAWMRGTQAQGKEHKQIKAYDEQTKLGRWQKKHEIKKMQRSSKILLWAPQMQSSPKYKIAVKFCYHR